MLRDSLSPGSVGRWCVGLLALSAVAAADVLDVPGDFPTIQEAIDAAVAGDEVVVAPGVYNEKIDFQGKAITVRCASGAAVTVISGAGLPPAPVVTCAAGEGRDSVLQGFTITAGAAPNGAGMFNRGSSPTINDCTFAENHATDTSGGGGMFNLDSSPVVTGCLFWRNIADLGAGMANHRFSSPELTGCSFEEGAASLSGGAVFNFVEPEMAVTLMNCTFTGNTADFGGAIHDHAFSSSTVVDCIFEMNRAGVLGGGISSFTGSGTVANLVGCTFAANTAQYGAGVALFGRREAAGGAGGESLARVEGCIFAGNAADVLGGGLVVAGGIVVEMSGVNSFNENGDSVLKHSGAWSTNRLFGTGLVDGGDLLLNTAGGQVSPGTAESAIGVMRIASPFSQVGPTAGTVEIDLAGTRLGTEYDQLVLEGETYLSGGLRVNLLDGFVPAIGQGFEIVTTRATATRFDVALLPALPSPHFMRVEYAAGAAASTTTVTLEIADLEQLIGFADPATVPLGAVPSDVGADDFDGINGMDLAMVFPVAGSDGAAVVLLNGGRDESGTWLGMTGGTTQARVGINPSAIASGDWDGDRDVDLAVTNAGENDVSILINLGDGHFVESSAVPVGAGPGDITVGDFDGDTDLDLAVANTNGHTVSILQNIGSGAFAPELVLLPAGTILPTSIASGDFDGAGTGSIDLIIGATDANTGLGQALVLENAGDGMFMVGVETALDHPPVSIVPEDVDNDKDLDGCVISNEIIGAAGGDPGFGGVSFLLNDGSGAFAPAVTLPLSGPGTSLEAIDADGDGDHDLIVIVADPITGRTARVIRNDPSDDQLAFVLVDVPLDAGPEPLLVVQGDLDGDSAADLMVVGGPLGDASIGQEPASLSVQINALCPADVNNDGDVGVLDLLAVLGHWGSCPAIPQPCPWDIDGNGSVDFIDLVATLAGWNCHPEP